MCIYRVEILSLYHKKVYGDKTQHITDVGICGIKTMVISYKNNRSGYKM